jgi:hypothetical protein
VVKVTSAGETDMSRRALVGLGAMLLVSGCRAQGPQSAQCQPQLTNSGTQTQLTCRPPGNGAPGTLTCTLDFGGVPIGQSATTTLTLGNAGFSSCDLTGQVPPNDPQFGVQTLPIHSSIAQGLPFTVSFKPFNEQPLTDSFTLLTDSQLIPRVIVNLTGSGIRLALSASPPSMDFGKVVIHSTSTQTLTLTNQSTGMVTVAPVATGGNSAALFQIQGALASGPKSLPPGGTTQLQVSFAPQRQSYGEEVAYLVATYADNRQVLVGLKGFGVTTALSVQPTRLSFGDIPVDQTYTQTVTVTNVSSLPVRVTTAWIDRPGQPAAFTTSGPQILPGSSFTLAGDQTLTYPITFAPGQGQTYQGDFAVVSDQGDNDHVPLTGAAGGPSISCVPTELDFGTVDVNVGSTLPVVCTNLGNDRYLPGGKIDVAGELQLFQSNLLINPSGSPFSAQLTVGGAPVTLVSLRARQSATLLVTYDPQSPSATGDSATLFVQSNDVLHPSVPIRLGGNGVTLNDCKLTTSPIALAFQQIAPGRSVTLPVTLTNTGSGECLVDGLALTPDSDPSFSLTSQFPTSILLAGSASGSPNQVEALVQFSPTGVGSFRGTLDFTISSHIAPMQSVPVSGSAATSCLQVAPQELDFGDVGLRTATQFCGSRSQRIRAYNTCSTPQTVTALSNTAQTVDFQITSSPSLPAVVLPGGFLELAEAFRPLSAGVKWGAATLVAQPTNGGTSTTYLAAFHGNAFTNQQTDTYVIPVAKVDVLWVVNYADMFNDQNYITSVANNIGSFFAGLQGADYHVGVISSVDCLGFRFGSPLATDFGQILPCSGCTDGSANAATIISSQDANPVAEMQSILGTFVQNGLQGNPQFNFCIAPPVNGNWDGDDVFQPAYLALQPGLLSGHNSGFLRNDAALVLIGLNDSDDLSQSITGNDTNFYSAFFQSVKGFNAQTPFIFNAISLTPSEATGNVFQCPANQNIFLDSFVGDTNIPLMVGQTGGQLFDVCTQDWATTLSDLGQASRAVQTTFVVNGSPQDPSAIQVAINGGGIPQYTRDGGAAVWSYDPVTGTLTFLNTSAVPGPGDVLTITYTNTCY